MTNTVAEQIALILTAPQSRVDPDGEADTLLKVLSRDGYGPAERSNICARLQEAAPYTTTYEDWVIQAKLALERA